MGNFIADRFNALSSRQQQSVIFTGIFIFGILLIGVGVWFKLRPVKMSTYTNQAYGFSIDYPSHWTVQEASPELPGVAAAFISPRENPLDGFSENVVIVIQDLSPKPMTLQQYTQTAVEQIRAVFEEHMEIVDSSPMMMAGRSAHKLIYQGAERYGKKTLKMMSVWIVEGKVVAYQVNFGAAADEFDKYLKIVNPMVQSFSVNR
jgi:serine/threonine-protein kinase